MDWQAKLELVLTIAAGVALGEFMLIYLTWGASRLWDWVRRQPS